MKQIKYYLLILIWLPISLIAQDQLLTLEDAVTNPAVYPKRLKNATWRSDQSYTYINDANELVEGDIKGGESTLLTLDKLNEAFNATGKLSLKRFPYVEWQEEDEMVFQHQSYVYVYDVKDAKLMEKGHMEENGENMDVSSEQAVAFTFEGNLYMHSEGDTEARAVSSDGEYDIVYGEAAHRSEFGITKGTFWSPSGDKLAFSRMDQSMVTDYPLVDYSTTPAENNPIKYPMAGGKSHHHTLGIYTLKNGKINYINTGEPKEQYLTNMTWGPDEKYMYIAVVNRDQNEMKLNQYDAKKGKFIKTLFDESDKEYVEPEHGPIFLPDSKDEFIWFSERDGFDHMYLYNTDGELIRQLTKGEWKVTDFIGFDEKGKMAYFSSTQESPLQRHLYSVELKSGEISKLTTEEGTHSGKISSDGRYLLDTYSNVEVPNVTQLIDLKKGKTIKKIHESPNPLKDYKTGEIELFSIKAEDGTDLYCRMIKPTDFDPSKKYPVMVYVYGGPHVQLVRNSWNGGAQLFLNYMSQRGFIVFTLDNRGSANRGLDFEQAIHRQVGTQELADQMEGVKYLRSQPYVNTDKMGVYGWSFGGFMTTSLMLREPGTFQAGVAGGPVIDWKFYEVMYTERYMDTPEQNPAGYEKAALPQYVNNLQGKLLVIHGLQDDVVVPQHTRSLLRACVEEGTHIDYLPYPSHPHNVRGRDRVHLLETISQYIIEHVK